MKLNKKIVIEALENSGGFVSEASKKLRCSSQAVYDFLKRNEDVKLIKQQIDERYLDMAESKLLQLINQGNLGAICFFLKCKGKNRGYVERQEVDHSGTTTQRIEVITAIPRPKELPIETN